jgi:hypothetical protein
MKVKIEGQIFETDGMKQILEYQGEVSPGVLLKGVWRNQKGEVIVLYYSIWDRGDGCHQGYYGIIADNDFVRVLKRIYKINVED